MTSKIPSKPNLKQLRNEARDILNAHHRLDASCCDVLRNLRQLSGKTDQEILATDVRLNQVQFALAMAYGFRTWQDLTAYIEYKAYSDLEDSYLSHDGPIRQSGFGGGAERWRRERGVILEAIDRDGDFLDVGCANGLLAQNLVEWGRERGLNLVPHGLDQGPRLIELAKQRLPEYAANFWVGDAWDWEPPKKFRYVYVLWDIAPDSLLGECFARLIDRCLGDDGRLIVGAYGSASQRTPARDATALLEGLGFPVLGSAESDDLPISHIAWTVKGHTRTRDVARYYASRAAEYDATAGYKDAEGEALREPMKIRYQNLFARHRVLEIACGTGYWTDVVAGTAQSVLSTDINEDLLAQARERTASRGNVECQIADAYTLGGVPTGFTAAFAMFWWSHVPRERLPAFLTSLHSKLEPGALVLFGDNLHSMRHDAKTRKDGHGNRLEERVLENGQHCWVVKNFPTEDEIRVLLSDIAREIAFEVDTDGEWWELKYRLTKQNLDV